MATILDQTGKPIDRGVLREAQTARLASLHGEFALHPARGLTPQRLYAILEGAERNDLTAQCDLFEDMEDRDTHILCEIGKRKRSLLGLEWDILPPRNASAEEKKAAAYAKELVQDIPDFEDLLLDMGDAIGKGYACVELGWRLDGKEWVVAEASHRPQRWFRLDQATRSELRLRDSSPDGAPLNPFGWVVHTHRAKSGYLGRAALYRTVVWPYLFKNYSVRDLAEFLEIYGLPVRIGTYPTGADDKEKATLLQAVVGIGHNAAGIIPEGMLIDFKESAKGQSDPYLLMMDWCERSESKAILGQVLSAEAKATGMGSGVADLQSEVRDDILVADAAQVGSTLTRDLVYPLLVLNGARIDSLRRCPRFAFDTVEPEDMKLYAEALPKLVSIGVQVPASYAHAKLKIPQPKDGEPVLSAPRPAPMAPEGEDPDGEPVVDNKKTGGQPPKKPKPPVAARAKLPGDDPEPDAPALQADRLAGEGGAALRPVLDRLTQIVQDATSLEALRDDLLAAYGHLPLGDLQAVMARAFAAADAAGRFEVSQGD